MKLSSLFKFKRNKSDIHSLLNNVFNKVESNLCEELQKDIYDWNKPDIIKQYECFILSRFLIDYSFSTLDNDLDKNMIRNFKKTSEEVFIELHDKKYSNNLDYKDVKNVIDEKYNLFFTLRNEHNPPECWNLIYSSLTGKNTSSEVQAEIIGLKKAIKSMKNKPGLDDLVSKFENGIIRKLKFVESFDLSEILFRQNVRLIKKELTSMNILKQLADKK